MATSVLLVVLGNRERAPPSIIGNSMPALPAPPMPAPVKPAPLKPAPLRPAPPQPAPPSAPLAH
jgi:hypothetical protein